MGRLCWRNPPWSTQEGAITIRRKIVYQSVSANGAHSEPRTYECRDDEDYKRCVDLFNSGKIKVLAVNDRQISKRGDLPKVKKSKITSLSDKFGT